MADSRREATYQDVLDAPEHMTAELIDGELFLSPRPAVPHAVSTMNLAMELAGPFMRRRGGGPGGWIILFEPELHFGKQVVVPDIAGWRHDRLQLGDNDKFLTIAPDWVCEALSKSTERIDRAKKMDVYLAAGVPHLWFLDERRRKLEVYRAIDGRFELIAKYDQKDVVRAVPFEAIELRIASLFTDLPNRTGEEAVDYGR